MGDRARALQAEMINYLGSPDERRANAINKQLRAACHTE
jgi:hypothetical protein